MSAPVHLVSPARWLYLPLISSSYLIVVMCVIIWTSWRPKPKGYRIV